MTDPAPLVVTDARLRGGDVVDVHCADGVVTALAPAGSRRPDGAVVVPADGGLVTEPFVDAHLHLDKVHTLPLVGDAALRAYTAGGMADSARGIDLARGGEAALHARPAAALDPRGAGRRACATACCTCRRSPTSTPRPGSSGCRRCSPPARSSGTGSTCRWSPFRRTACCAIPARPSWSSRLWRLGADVVGGIPWIEATAADQEAHVEWACALAARLGRRVAMLTDDAPRPGATTPPACWPRRCAGTA